MRNSYQARGGSTEKPVTRLNQDSLIALPPNLRAGVLEGEADHQERNAPTANQGTTRESCDEGIGNGPRNGPGYQMNNPTFLATHTRDLGE